MKLNQKLSKYIFNFEIEETYIHAHILTYSSIPINYNVYFVFIVNTKQTNLQTAEW